MREYQKYIFASHLQDFLLQLRVANPDCWSPAERIGLSDIKKLSQLIPNLRKVSFDEFEDLLAHRIGFSYRRWSMGYYTGRVHVVATFVNIELNGNIAVITIEE